MSFSADLSRIPGDDGGLRPGIRSRSAETASRIKELVLKLGLRPGDPMPTETELGKYIGVSRSSLREAMKTLATLGIVEVRHGHGTYVGRMTLDSLVETLVFRGALMPGDDLHALHEIIEVRQGIDIGMAEQVIDAIEGTENPELWRTVGEMERLSADGKTFAEFDRAFHTQLLGRIHNALIGQLVGAFWDVHTAVMPQLGVSLPDDLIETARAHADMLRAAEAGDVDGYRRAAKQHYAPLIRALQRTENGPPLPEEGEAGRPTGP